MTAIFLSHSSADNGTAEELRLWLAEKGHQSVFLDFDPANGIPAGRDWERELYRNIRVCRGVIVLCSRHSMASRWCFVEITHARALGKHLFPVRIDDCTVDSILTDRQVIDLAADKADGLQRLWRGLIAAGLEDNFPFDPRRPVYPGLLAFEEADAAIFFGRSDEIWEGLELLNRARRLEQAGLVKVLGASGSGKSSLVRAGLLPRLRLDPGRWLVVEAFRPRGDPLRALADALSAAFRRFGPERPADQIRDRLLTAMAQESGAEEAEARPHEAAGLDRLLALLAKLATAVPAAAQREVELVLDKVRALDRPAPGSPHAPAEAAQDAAGGALNDIASELRRLSGHETAKVLLIIDQFEELFTAADSDRFIRTLRSSLDAADSPILVLGTMRSDFLEAFQNFPALHGLRYESLSLGALSPGDIAQVITEPAALAAIDLEPGLAQALVDDAATGDALPLLAFTLRELNERYGGDGRLTLDEYRQLGGLQGAVAKAADGLMQGLDASQEALLRTAFLRMVRATEDGRYARRPVRWDDLAETARPLLDRFIKGRLLVAGGDAAGRTIEVAHEALFRTWDRLVRWLAENAAALRLHHEIEQTSQSWDENGRADEYLWKGLRLARARELLAGDELPLAPPERAFVEASDAAERAVAEAIEARRRRDRRRLMTAAGIFAVLFVAAAGAAGWAWIAKNEAVKQQVAASQADSRTLALFAEGLLNEGKIDDAIGLARRALVGDDGKLKPYTDEAGLVLAQGVSRYYGLDFGVRGIGHPTFIRGGKELFFTLADKGAPVWRIIDATSGQLIVEARNNPGEIGPVLGVTIADEGAKIVTASQNGAVVLWDGRTGEQQRAFRAEGGRPDSPAWSAVFNRDETLLLSSDYYQSTQGAKIWSTSTGDVIARFDPGPSVYDARFAADDKRIVTVGARGVALWDPQNGTQVGTDIAFRNSPGQPPDILVSNDGESVFVPKSNSVTMIDAADGSVRKAIDDLIGSIVMLAFDSSGALRIATEDGRWYALDAKTLDRIDRGRVLHVRLEGRSQALRVVRAALAPVAGHLVTTDGAGTARVWSADREEPLAVLVGDRRQVDTVAISPDGEKVVTVGAGGVYGHGLGQVWHARPRVEKASSSLPNPLPDGRIDAAFCAPDFVRLLLQNSPDPPSVWRSDRPGRVPLQGEMLPPGHDIQHWSWSTDADGSRVIQERFGRKRAWDADTGLESPLDAGDQKSTTVPPTRSGSPRPGRHAAVENGNIVARGGTDNVILDVLKAGALCAALMPDGERVRFVAAGDPSDAIKDWHVAPFQTLDDVVAFSRRAVPQDLSDRDLIAKGLHVTGGGDQP